MLGWGTAKKFAQFKTQQEKDQSACPLKDKGGSPRLQEICEQWDYAINVYKYDTLLG